MDSSDCESEPDSDSNLRPNDSSSSSEEEVYNAAPEDFFAHNTRLQRRSVAKTVRKTCFTNIFACSISKFMQKTK